MAKKRILQPWAPQTQLVGPWFHGVISCVGLLRTCNTSGSFVSGVYVFYASSVIVTQIV